MAERLRYKSQAQPLRLPQLQFTGAAADAQGKQQVANSLGQMTSFFLQQTQIQAKLQGEEIRYPERCLARIDAVEYPYPRRKESRPTPRTATCIKAQQKYWS